MTQVEYNFQNAEVTKREGHLEASFNFGFYSIHSEMWAHKGEAMQTDLFYKMDSNKKWKLVSRLQVPKATRDVLDGFSEYVYEQNYNDFTSERCL
jgi:hypothetical protein